MLQQRHRRAEHPRPHQPPEHRGAAQRVIGVTQVNADGDEVRLICRAGAYKQWIDSTKTIKRPVRCGDVVQYTIDTAQAYVGKKKQGDPMLTAEAVAERRRKSPGMVIGFYGEMTLEPGSNPEIITRCCDLYQEHQAINLDNGPTVGGQDDMPDV